MVDGGGGGDGVRWGVLSTVGMEPILLLASEESISLPRATEVPPYFQGKDTNTENMSRHHGGKGMPSLTKANPNWVSRLPFLFPGGLRC